MHPRSFHEMALYDVSSMIDYVLRSKNQSSLVYVAHSMGTTMGLVLLSMRPEYNEKIRLVINMGSVGNWRRPQNLIRFFHDHGHRVQV